MITKNKQNIALVYYARFRSILKILKRKCERFSIVCQHCYMFWLEFAESQRALIEQCINKLFVCIFFFSVTDGKQTPEISWVDIFEAHTRFPARTRTGGCLKFPLVDCFISCGCDWLFVYGQMWLLWFRAQQFYSAYLQTGRCWLELVVPSAVFYAASLLELRCSWDILSVMTLTKKKYIV